MKLLLLCPHFEPDLHAATGEVMTNLVLALAERGHRVDVVTSLPWYHQHKVEPEWSGRPWRRETTPFGTITRVWPFPTAKTNIPARAVGFGGFTSLVTAAALTLGRPDIVLGMSPPIFLGDAASVLARRWRVPFIFNVQDIFPDVAVELGALSNPRAIGLAEKHERSVYRRAGAVTVLSEDQAGNVRAKTDPKKVRIIHNFVDLDRIKTVDRQTAYRHRHGLGAKTVVMYSGNVGLSQSFDLVRAAALAWADRPDVHFVINGEGAARRAVDEWAADLPNVLVTDFAPRDQVNDVLGAADLHLILLKAGLSKSSTPSKLYGVLAAGRALLASIDTGSEVDMVIARAEAGCSVPPNDEAAFLVALEEMLADSELLADMGDRGREFVEQWMTPAAQAEAYEKLFEELIEGEPR
ncbi:MAG: colanic acid biosynthesis glycosyl transferase WcaI [Acidimicrobiales bacterium]|jgi:colanic acid biosynthesis glycosyl transferase WcaI